MSQAFAYLDHNATTRLRPEALTAMAAVVAGCGNPSSVHHAGREARRVLAGARETVGRAIGLAQGGTVIFTSGGTEANHLALKGSDRRRLLRSAIEHESVRAAAEAALVVPVEPEGTVDLAALDAMLRDGPAALVSIMVANNETGVIQPIEAVVRLAHACGALVHCDAIQAVGKIPFDMARLGVDLATVSAHKLGGPPGVAALAVRPGLVLTPLLTGGGQESGLRAGTENLPGIAGFAAAIECAVAELDLYAGLAILRDDLARRLSALEPQAIVFGAARPRLPNTLSIALPGVSAEIQVMALDLAGIGVSAGAACSSGKIRPSHVLEAMGADADTARSAIRISLGAGTTADELDRVVEAWGALAQRTADRRAAA